MLIAARDTGVRKVVCAGFSSVYGDSPVMPKTESMDPNPLSPYSISKRTGLYYWRVFHDLYGLQIVTLPLF